MLACERFPKKVKDKFCKVCVRTTVADGSDTFNVKSVEEAVHRRTERESHALKDARFETDRRNASQLVDTFCLKEIIIEVVKRSELKWMGHVSRKEDDEPMERA